AYLNTSKYEPVPDGRYLAPLLPLAAIALGAAANVGLGRRPGLLRLAGCLAIGAFLVLQPLQQLGAYYARAIHETPTNERLVKVVADITAARQPAEPVLLDARLNTVTIRTRGADEEAASYRGLRYLLTIAEVPFEVVELDAATLEARRQAAPRSLVI